MLPKLLGKINPVRNKTPFRVSADMPLASLISNGVKSSQYHIFLAVCIALISFISFSLGKISQNDQKQLKVTEGANIYQAAKRQETSDQVKNSPTATPKPLDMRVVVSKASDSKKYHHVWCNSWKKIKLENQVWFNSAQEAETAGYTLAGNCSK